MAGRSTGTASASWAAAVRVRSMIRGVSRRGFVAGYSLLRTLRSVRIRRPRRMRFGFRLAQRLVDKPGHFDALFHALVQHESQDRREARLQPLGQLRLDEAGGVAQTVQG